MEYPLFFSPFERKISQVGFFFLSCLCAGSSELIRCEYCDVGDGRPGGKQEEEELGLTFFASLGRELHGTSSRNGHIRVRELVSLRGSCYLYMTISLPVTTIAV